LLWKCCKCVCYPTSDKRHRSLCMLLGKLHVGTDIVKVILTENFGEQKLCACFIPHWLMGNENPHSGSMSKSFWKWLIVNNHFRFNCYWGRAWNFKHDAQTCIKALGHLLDQHNGSKQQYSNDIFTQEESIKKHLFHKDEPHVLIFI
jgi:hypothetical protein